MVSKEVKKPERFRCGLGGWGKTHNSRGVVRQSWSRKESIGERKRSHPTFIHKYPVNLSGDTIRMSLMVTPSIEATRESEILKLTGVKAVVKLIHIRGPMCCTTNLISGGSYGIEVTESHPGRSGPEVKETTPKVMSTNMLIGPIDKSGKENQARLYRVNLTMNVLAGLTQHINSKIVRVPTYKNSPNGSKIIIVSKTPMRTNEVKDSFSIGLFHFVF